MLNERELVRAMKDAYKCSGYTIAGYDSGGCRKYIIAGPDWLVACDAPMLPRKALSLVVEHLGTLPHDEAFRVRKDEKPQTVLPDAPVGLFCDFYGKRGAALYKTRLVLDGLELWQEQDGNGLMLMKPALTGIAVVTEDWQAVQSGNALTVDTGTEFAAIVQVDADHHPGMERLTQFHWEK